MAKADSEKNDENKGNQRIAATIGLVAAGAAIIGGAAYAASRKAKSASDELDFSGIDIGDMGTSETRADDIDAEEFAPVVNNEAESDLDVIDDDSVEDMPGVVPEPMRYTGSGTPDMAVSYTPGLDQDDSRVASAPFGEEIGEVGTAEQRDALAGVQS